MSLTGSTRATAPTPRHGSWQRTMISLSAWTAARLAHEALAAAQAADVVVLDHHLGGETLARRSRCGQPEPARRNRRSGPSLRGRSGLSHGRRRCRIMREHRGKGPDLISMLDLVALATVADVAPLDWREPSLCAAGLESHGPARARWSCRAVGCGRPDTRPSAYHLGYRAGTTDQRRRAHRQGRSWAHGCCPATRPSRSRRAGRKAGRAQHRAPRDRGQVRAAALAQAEARGLDAPLVWAAGRAGIPAWSASLPPASKKPPDRPAVVIGFDGDRAKASGRSVSGIDLGAAIQRLAREGLDHGRGRSQNGGRSVTDPRAARALPWSDFGAIARGIQGAGALGPADLKT